MTWVSIVEFTTRTGISVSDSSIVSTALEFAEKDIQRHIFRSLTYSSSYNTSTHRVSDWIMDTNGDLTINTSDIDAYEIDVDNNYYDLNGESFSVSDREKKVVFTSDVPTSGRILYIDYKTGRERFDNMKIELQELELLKAANWFYNKIPIQKMQQGVSSWSINGVSISFDGSAMKSVYDDNTKEINKLLNQLRIKQASHFKPGQNTKSSLFYKNRGSLL